jgi:hypothetical protein
VTSWFSHTVLVIMHNIGKCRHFLNFLNIVFRILGDRFSHSVKTAVLDTLASLLKKAGSLLKPFFPQLQTTFMKALNDPNRTVRLKAGVALAYLIAIHMRPGNLTSNPNHSISVELIHLWVTFFSSETNLNRQAFISCVCCDSVFHEKLK